LFAGAIFLGAAFGSELKFGTEKLGRAPFGALAAGGWKLFAGKLLDGKLYDRGTTFPTYDGNDCGT
jgi:hypothetical protein